MGQLKKKKKKKQAMGLGESFTFLAKSPYIRDLATLVRSTGTWSCNLRAAPFWAMRPYTCDLATELPACHEQCVTRLWHSAAQHMTACKTMGPGGCVRHQHQPGGGDMEEQDQGAVPQPQRLQRLHGRLLVRHGRRHLHHDAPLALHLPQGDPRGSSPARLPPRASCMVLLCFVSRMRAHTFMRFMFMVSIAQVRLAACAALILNTGCEHRSCGSISWLPALVGSMRLSPCSCGTLLPCAIAHQVYHQALQGFIFCLTADVLPHRSRLGVQYGWGVAAIITPTVLLITGVAFFGLVLGSGPLTPTLASIGLTPLMAAVLVRPQPQGFRV